MEGGGKGGKKTREMRWGGLVNDGDSVRGERESRPSRLETGEEEEMI